MNPPEVRYDPTTGRVAIRTTRPSAQAWFVFDPQGSGHYAPGTRSPDKADDWPPYEYTPPEEGP